MKGIAVAALTVVAALMFLLDGTSTAEDSEGTTSAVVVVPQSPEAGSAAIYLNDRWTAVANTAYNFGSLQDGFISGDWDGDGFDSLGISRSISYYLRNSASAGLADYYFIYGRVSDQVLVGDWDGDGIDTVAVRRGNVFHIQNSLVGGEAETVIVYGKSTDEVVVGDWDGDGKDSLAVRRGVEYHIRNTLTSGVAEEVIIYGKTSDVVLAGDWDGDGIDTLAVRRGAEYHVRNSLTSGVADLVLRYGRTSDEVIVGDWNGDGMDTLGVIRRDGSVPTELADHNPVGTVDEVSDNKDGTLTVRGWTLDPDTTQSLTVAVYVDGAMTAVEASLERSDVATQYGLTSSSYGYNTTISATAGTHRVCVLALNEQVGSNTLLGCSDVKVTVDPDVTFVAGNIISDSVMFDSGTMTQSQIQTFLNQKNANCVAGEAACLKNYKAASSTMDTAYCETYQGATSETAAAMIYKAATACGVNPQVLLVMLQKEQGLVTLSGSGLTSSRYNKALGYACPDGSECNSTYAGLARQLYYAASRLVEYGERPSAFRFAAGGTYTIAYSPDASCGSAQVKIVNRATAALYNYTPYQPNAAALENMYGTGDSCSSYGNRNFWRTFISWFGAAH